MLESSSGITIDHTFSKYRSEYLLRNNIYFLPKSLTNLSLDQVQKGSILRINFESKNQKYNYTIMTDFFKQLHIGTQVEYKPPFQILELRIKHKIDEDSLISMICEFCKTNNNLRDLELVLKNNDTI